MSSFNPDKLSELFNFVYHGRTVNAEGGQSFYIQLKRTIPVSKKNENVTSQTCFFAFPKLTSNRHANRLSVAQQINGDSVRFLADCLHPIILQQTAGIK